MVLALVVTACTHGAAAEPAESRATRRTDVPLWSTPLSHAPGALTTDGDGTVVLGGHAQVVALDGEGRTRWRTDVDRLSIEYPALGAGLVVVSADPAGDGATGAFVALDRRDGNVRWRVGVAEEPAAVTVTPVGVFAATTGGDLWSFSFDGRVRWRTHLAATITPRGAIAYDATTGVVALVVADARRWALVLRDAATGADRGGLALGAVGRAGPPSAVALAAPGRLMLGIGETHEVVLVDLRAGRVSAAVATTDAFDPSSVPAVAGDLAVVVDRSGTVTALDPATGARRWQARLDRPTLDTRPAVTAGSVAVTDWGRNLVVLDRASGRVRRSPASGAGGLAVAVGAGASRLVVALRLASPDRVEAWSVP